MSASLPLEASANLPAGHALRHAPPSKYGVPDAGQETHAVEPAASHSPTARSASVPSSPTPPPLPGQPP